ncbi:MAG: ExbD/TolR family protein [Oleiphilus sp.]
MNFVQQERVKKKANEDNLIPLINVVFLMLIFFMVAGVIRETDTSDIVHPESVSKKMLAQNTVDLLVHPDLSLEMGEERFSTAQLTKKLKVLLESYQSIEDLHLVLRVDNQLQAKQLHQVLHSIRKAGLLKVQLLTEQLSYNQPATKKLSVNPRRFSQKEAA